MEEPHAGIVSLEPQDNVAICRHYGDIAFRWNNWKRIFVAVPGSGTSGDDLENMTLLMSVGLMWVMEDK